MNGVAVKIVDFEVSFNDVNVSCTLSAEPCKPRVATKRSRR
ncbi:MAG: hypothetical protein QW677_03870 [Pyrobaculum sp.]|nr:hypothetical protein [Pyrobaculum arsenaticum]